MSRFFSEKFSDLVPYVPGEQPQDQQYTKLNTNESPFPPSPAVVQAMRDAGASANLYCDPQCRVLCSAIAKEYGVQPDQVLPVNGSDEIINFAVMAFCDETHPLAYADITYGCYPVFADFNRQSLLGAPAPATTAAWAKPSSSPTPTPPRASLCRSVKSSKSCAQTRTMWSSWTRHMWPSVRRAAWI